MSFEKNQELYITDDIKFVSSCIKYRLKNYDNESYRDTWETADVEFEKSSEGYDILRICKQEVMTNLQVPYMKELAKTACKAGGKILNIGYGLGIADNFIEEFREKTGVTEHHIIELNENVFKKAQEWRDSQKFKDKIFIYQGSWEDITPELSTQFDGILYDGYPLDKSLICRDAIPFLAAVSEYKLLAEKTGILTFFMDSVNGFGEDFKKYIKTLNYASYFVKKASMSFNEKADVLQYENFLVPILSGIEYKQ
jgi:hypothetical protein